MLRSIPIEGRLMPRKALDKERWHARLSGQDGEAAAAPPPPSVLDACRRRLVVKGTVE